MPQQVVEIALLNSAGQFGSPDDSTTEIKESILHKLILKPLKEIFQRVVLGFLFRQAKQPARVESVLKSINDTVHVKSEKIHTRQCTKQTVLPIVVSLGDFDPWMGPTKANRIKEFYLNTKFVNFQAGHCPHDEVPELANKALVSYQLYHSDTLLLKLYNHLLLKLVKYTEILYIYGCHLPILVSRDYKPYLRCKGDIIQLHLFLV